MQEKERIYGLDLIRLVAFLAIIIFHASWALWFEVPNPLPTKIWRIAEFFARCLSFSGFTILFLSTFLMAFKSNGYSKSRWLPFFLMVGWILFCVCTYLKEKSFTLTWDIYPLIAVGLIFGKFLMNMNKHIQIFFAILCVALLSFPVWNLPFVEKLPVYLREILFGQCLGDFADWPLFPWIGLMGLGFLSGVYFRKRKEAGFDFHFHRFEPAMFLILGIYFWEFKSVYFHTKLGDGWACYTFRQNPETFWAHLLFWMSLIRIGFHPKVQKYLKEKSWMRFISRLQVNQHFFLVYLLHYLILFSLIEIFDPEQKAMRVDWILLLIFPLSELACRSVILLGDVFSERRRGFEKAKSADAKMFRNM